MTPNERKIHNTRIREQIMDLRDQRFRIYKIISELEDKQAFNPKHFSVNDAYWLKYHKADVARIKAEEARLRAMIH